ncbi:MAG: hypothetical protein HZB65_04050 [Candidatus Aenigmarchaeota archaeon]|nr:hypothetical protein [Candidatus Aenigmarchaeota archaeon]
MKFTIVNEKDNPHMKRKQLVLAVDHVGGATPSMTGLQTVLSNEFSIEPERIEIKSIYSLKGLSQSKASVFIWEENKVENLSKPKEESKKEGE